MIDHELDDAIRTEFSDLARVAPPLDRAALRRAIDVGRTPARPRHLLPATAAAAVIAIAASTIAIAGLRADHPPTQPIPSADPDLGRAEDAPPGRTAARADHVRAVADPIAALSDEPGFGKVEVDLDQGTVTVYWKGRPPASVPEGMTEDGVEVSVVETPYSESDLASAARSVRAAAREAGVAITVIGRTDELDGLVVWVTSLPSNVPDLEEELRQAVNGPRVELRSGLEYQPDVGHNGP